MTADFADADIDAGPWQMHWNANPDADGSPPDPALELLGIGTPNRTNQVGCVYSAQGFEFDYVGVMSAATLAGIGPPTLGSATRTTPTTQSSSNPATASPTSSSAPIASSSSGPQRLL
jgi:hypothetical protein